MGSVECFNLCFKWLKTAKAIMTYLTPVLNVETHHSARQKKKQSTVHSKTESNHANDIF